VAHPRDWGRGLRYEHLTQNENKEKLAHPDQVVGKFGVGLKDALATFDRHRVAVVIRSRYGDITTAKQAKHGFTDIRTLHALITEPTDPGFTGTEFILHGDALGEPQVQEAKALFLRYSGDEELGLTPFGTVLRRANARARARIYVNGLRVAEEDNFLFSYNITAPTAALRRALNRERSNVGRSAYTDRVKSILLACDQDEVIDALVADLQNYERGSQHDETQWLDVGLHACQQLNARRQVIFLAAYELAYAADFVQRAGNDGYEIIVVPETIRRKLMPLTSSPRSAPCRHDTGRTARRRQRPHTAARHPHHRDLAARRRAARQAGPRSGHGRTVGFRATGSRNVQPQHAIPAPVPHRLPRPRPSQPHRLRVRRPQPRLPLPPLRAGPHRSRTHRLARPGRPDRDPAPDSDRSPSCQVSFGMASVHAADLLIGHLS
jgi:hypothetical protein